MFIIKITNCYIWMIKKNLSNLSSKKLAKKFDNITIESNFKKNTNLMRKKINKNIKKRMDKIIKKLEKNKYFNYILKSNYLIRVFGGVGLFLFGIFAWLTPIPFATLFLVAWLVLLFSLKSVKCKVLYILNRRYIIHLCRWVFLKYKYRKTETK